MKRVIKAAAIVRLPFCSLSKEKERDFLPTQAGKYGKAHQADTPLPQDGVIRLDNPVLLDIFSLRRHSQVVRRRSAKPLFLGSSPGAALKPHPRSKLRGWGPRKTKRISCISG